ncbi:MAG TPA: hydrogenase nickel incorporation protein HypB [Usitatibacter sp.]|nr:hydrogenase nickel incorporation protein HypB [Usitatibacter sp.]
MCEQCGCGSTPGTVRVTDSGRTISSRPAAATTVEVHAALLAENDRVAAHNRAHFEEHGVLAVNLMSSPGSGKTSLLEATLDAAAGRWRIGVIEGDLETENDALRIRAKGVPAVQITTGQACHLDAGMVHDALHALDLHALDILFIENVGNLVCPASFDLGQSANVTLLSVTEGDDKPAKYPVMFRAADLVLLAKSDLLDVLDDFDPAKARRHVRELANPAPVLAISARRPATLRPWLDWLEGGLAAVRAHPGMHAHPQGHSHRHEHSHGHEHPETAPHSHPRAADPA